MKKPNPIPEDQKEFYEDMAKWDPLEEDKERYTNEWRERKIKQGLLK